jgi:hypothetical protein
MPEITPPNLDDAGLEVNTFFVRSRNVLLARANFGSLFVDYYLHLSQQQMRPSPEADGMFKRALAAFVLHCASRPRNELAAWTINFQKPLLNLFLTGDNETGAVTGRVFEEDVKELPENLFYADVVRRGPDGQAQGWQPKRRSTVSFSGSDPIGAAIVGAASTVIGAIGAVLGAITSFTIAGIAVGRILLQVGLNLAFQSLFAPKKASVAQRQAQTLELTLGEAPAEAVAPGPRFERIVQVAPGRAHQTVGGPHQKIQKLFRLGFHDFTGRDFRCRICDI